MTPASAFRPPGAANLVLRALPLAAQGVWFHLWFSSILTEAGRCVRFHCEVSEALRRVFPADDAETNRALESLIAAGLVTRGDEGRTLWFPNLGPPPKKRVPIKPDAREKGARGGRPRTNETAQQARQRRDQTSLLLPLPNPSAEVRETPEENRGAATTTTSTDSVQSESKSVATVETVKALGAELAEASGFDGARSPVQHRPIRKWLAAGARPALIRQVVARVAARGSYEAGRVHSLYYFDKAVLEALEEGEEVEEAAPLAGRVPLTAAEREAELSPFTRSLLDWLANGRFGPMPVRDAA